MPNYLDGKFQTYEGSFSNLKGLTPLAQQFPIIFNHFTGTCLVPTTAGDGVAYLGSSHTGALSAGDGR